MNKRGFAFLFTLLLAFASCKSGPGRAPDPETGFAGERAAEEAAPGGAALEDTGSEIDETGLPPEDAEGLPFAETAPEEPPETVLPGELREPEIDPAEADTAAVPPAEDETGTALPEPALGQLPVPEEPPPAAEGPPPEPEQPAAPPVPPPGPPPALPRPAVPPQFLGPAEELPPPPPAREPVPVPARPQPNPPASGSVPPGPEEEIVFSRTVRATVGQLVEIPFRGTGWVYLGELGARRGLVYDSRRIDPEGQSFMFRAEAAGTYALKFYRQDFIRDFILNDHVRVLVGEAPETAGSGWFNPPVDRGRVRAEPRWPTNLEEGEIARRDGRPAAAGSAGGTAGRGDAAEGGAGQNGSGPGRAGSSAPVTAEAPPVATGETPPAAAQSPETPDNPPSARPGDSAPESPALTLPPNLSPADYLGRAREEFEAGRVASAISVLDQFREYYPSGSDEAYWLYGQFYEANSPGRDILTALDYYRRLVREYPQSKRCNEARRRIAYLERYYINIQ